ncbi:hypothetical protein B0186_04985 [Canicola haemoglobinophilus]|uniref:phage tail-collar fiber domain-containing protein n=1 Tax=Canicola haemoglobinophilus TaxID=733 RepID=UPI0009942496|nr:phage tail protein [Canicola haemoglobinophilus]OOS01094.1 hypothetical protein B0186_04985 [Canicola haemoglobinophilus]
MATLVTQDFEREIAEKTINGGVIQYDEFIFAMIPNLTADNLAQYLTIPSENLIKHRQEVSKAGVINENAVVYSVTLGTEIGDFDFNWIGLINKRTNKLAVAVQADTIKKTRNKNNVQGNSLTRNVLLEFAGAKKLTQINVSADTWQIDFTVRLHGIDEKIRLTNRDLYGRAVFFDDAFLVKRGAGTHYTIDAGHAYVEGVRAEIKQAQTIQAASLPCSIYLDVVHHCTVTGAYETEIKFLKQSKSDYLDSANRQHYVQIIADIDSAGAVTDRRLLSQWFGITPKDLDDTTESMRDKTGHTHKLPLASLIEKGLVQLYSGTDSDSEEMAATTKVVKEVKELAESKQSPADTLAGYGIANFKIEQSTGNANDYKTDGNYYFANGQNLPDSNAWHIEVVSGGQANAVRQIARKANDTKIKTRFFNGSSWTSWKDTGGDGIPIGAIVAFPKEVTNPQGFLLVEDLTFNPQTYPDLYRALGNKNKVSNIKRSDVGMLAYFPTDNIPDGWIDFDSIRTTVTQQNYPELYQHLVAKYGSINNVPLAEDRFIRSAHGSLAVGQKQNDEIKAHTHKLISYYGRHDENTALYGEGFEFEPQTDRSTVDSWGDGTLDDNGWIKPTNTSKYATGGAETRPKAIAFKLCIKAKNSFDDVRFWIKAFGSVENEGQMNAAHLAQDIQDIRASTERHDTQFQQYDTKLQQHDTKLQQHDAKLQQLEGLKKNSKAKVIWRGNLTAGIESRITLSESMLNKHLILFLQVSSLHTLTDTQRVCVASVFVDENLINTGPSGKYKGISTGVYNGSSWCTIELECLDDTSLRLRESGGMYLKQISAI